MTSSHDALRTEVNPACSKISQKEHAIRNLVGRVYTRYLLFMRAQSASYRDLLSAVIADLQMMCGYLAGTRVWVFENGRSPRIVDIDSKVELGDCTPPSGVDEN